MSEAAVFHDVIPAHPAPSFLPPLPVPRLLPPAYSVGDKPRVQAFPPTPPGPPLPPVGQAFPPTPPGPSLPPVKGRHSRKSPLCHSRKFLAGIQRLGSQTGTRSKTPSPPPSPSKTREKESPPCHSHPFPYVLPASSPYVLPAGPPTCHSRKSPPLSFPQVPPLSFPQFLAGIQGPGHTLNKRVGPHLPRRSGEQTHTAKKRAG